MSSASEESTPETKYINEGPEGAPKVLATVHIAYPRGYLKDPSVPIGSFVLSFYKLQFRKEHTKGNNKWVYTKLFTRIEVNENSDIETRFEKELPESQEFLANSDDDYKFNPEDFLKRINKQSEVSESGIPEGNKDVNHIGDAFALIEFDCDNFNLVDKDSLKKYRLNSIKSLWIVPVKLLNPRVIFIHKETLCYALSEIKHGHLRDPCDEYQLTKRFDMYESPNQFQEIKRAKARFNELKNDYLNIKKSTDTSLNELVLESKQIEENIKKIAAEYDEKKGETWVITLKKIDTQALRIELTKKIKKREQILNEILNEGRTGNFFQRNTPQQYRDYKANKEANSFMSEKDYNDAKLKVSEIDKIIIPEIEELEKKAKEPEDKLYDSLRDIRSSFKQNKDKQTSITEEFNKNPIVIEYLKLENLITEHIKRIKRPYIFYSYDNINFDFSDFFIDPDFSESSLIGLVWEDLKISEGFDKGVRPKGGKRRSTKSKKSMKSKRTKRTQYLKHTKKYRRRSHRK